MRIIITGDTGTGSTDQYLVARGMEDYSIKNKMKKGDGIILLGDNIYESGDNTLVLHIESINLYVVFKSSKIIKIVVTSTCWSDDFDMYDYGEDNEEMYAPAKYLHFERKKWLVAIDNGTIGSGDNSFRDWNDFKVKYGDYGYTVIGQLLQGGYVTVDNIPEEYL